MRPVRLLLRWAGSLRFPYLLALTALLFLVDVLVPDFLPFADEIILGVITLLLGSWRKRREGPSETRPT